MGSPKVWVAAALVALVAAPAAVGATIGRADAQMVVGDETELPWLTLGEDRAGEIGKGTIEIVAPKGFEFATNRLPMVRVVDGKSCTSRGTLRLADGNVAERTVFPESRRVVFEVTRESRGRCTGTINVTGMFVRAFAPGRGELTLGGTSVIAGVPAGTSLGTLTATAPVESQPGWTWGSNLFGEAGVGNAGGGVQEPTKVNVASVRRVAAGERTSFAARIDGTVWGWGANWGSVLGADRPSEVHEPVAIAGIDGVAELAAGYGHVVALRTDGSVWTWGGNWAGQLGTGTTADRALAAPVPGLAGVVAISAGRESSYAVTADGTLYAWGGNSHGEQLSGSLYGLVATPTARMTGVRTVAAGDYFALALRQDGTVWGGGNNDWGQLGFGAPSPDRPTPAQAQGIEGVTALFAGDHSSFAITSDGAVWGWGMNGWGQTGVGFSSESVGAPTRSSAPAGATAVAAGQYHTHVLLADGSVWSVGSDYYGQLGVGYEVFEGSVTFVRTHLSGVTAIAAREDHSLAATG